MAKKITSLKDLTPDPQNANAGTERGQYLVEHSLESFGAGRSILADANGVVIAGNKTLQAAADMGLEVEIVQSDGKKLVVVQRTDLDLMTDKAARELAYADNRASEVGLAWDTERILDDMQGGVDLDQFFRADELEAILGEEIDLNLLIDQDIELENFRHDAFVFPSDNEWGIPSLNIHRQAKGIIGSFIKWGTMPRSQTHVGSYHFYADDYKFEALWSDPSILIQSGCKVIVEPNFSTHAQLPKAIALYDIWRKRWLTRFWQENGIHVLVDLNVEPIFDDINLLGVPVGWKAYCTRCYMSMLNELERQYHLACTHAKTEDILFVIYGGRENAKTLADKYGWLHFPEQASEVHDG